MSTNRLEERLRTLRASGGRGVAPYVTAGDGGLERTRRVLLALERAGVTCVELGLPFSDPIADGPLLQAAAQRSLDAGTNLTAVLAMLKDLRADGFELPVILFTYANPLIRHGWKQSLARVADAGFDGVLVPDVPVEEGGTLRESANEHGLCPIFFVAPTTSAERIRIAAERSRGFLYTIGRFGVTGGATELDPAMLTFLDRVRAATELPIAVGFGIATSAQVATVTQHADVAIVGSALVQHVHEAGEQGGDDAAVRAAHDFVAALLEGVHA